MNETASSHTKKAIKNPQNLVIHRSHLAEYPLIVIMLTVYIFKFFYFYSTEQFLFRISLLNLQGTELGIAFSVFDLIFILLIVLILFLTHNKKYIIKLDSAILIKGRLTPSLQVTDVYFNKIVLIEVQQGFIQRLLNIGDVIIKTDSTLDMDLIFDGISRPFQVKNLIERRKARNETSSS